jgi:NADH:ubiquinone oxidoreductase subunit C
VETIALHSKINQILPGLVLEKQPFGRNSDVLIWLETKALLSSLKKIREDSDLALDWLENVSMAQMDGVFILTYFLRSRTAKTRLLVRASCVPASSSSEIELPSVAGLWPTAAPMEREIGELFGVRFVDAQGARAYLETECLPQGWRGFPLRKDYIFPKEILGIAHSRARNFPEGGS